MLDEREHIHINQVIHHQSARDTFKLRISAHKLQIEIGRYQGQEIS
jgi:hypothetical protein